MCLLPSIDLVEGREGILAVLFLEKSGKFKLFPYIIRGMEDF